MGAVFASAYSHAAIVHRAFVYRNKSRQHVRKHAGVFVPIALREKDAADGQGVSDEAKAVAIQHGKTKHAGPT
jgi:hypothetical protein